MDPLVTTGMLLENRVADTAVVIFRTLHERVTESYTEESALALAVLSRRVANVLLTPERKVNKPKPLDPATEKVECK